MWGNKVQYIKTEFDIRDDSTAALCRCVVGTLQDELPQGVAMRSRTRPQLIKSAMSADTVRVPLTPKLVATRCFLAIILTPHLLDWRKMQPDTHSRDWIEHW